MKKAVDLSASSPSGKSPEGLDVPERLVSTAIQLYGEKGTQGVSLREITRQAGVLNEAAVRYYFKDKAGLLDAAVETVMASLAPLLQLELKRLQESRADDTLDVAGVLTALASPLLVLHLRSPQSIRLLARLIREEGADGQDLLLQHFGPVIWDIEAYLRELLPDKKPEILRLHFFLAINNLLNGLCDMTLLWRLPAVDDPAKRFQLPFHDLADHFLEYMVAGVSTELELRLSSPFGE